MASQPARRGHAHKLVSLLSDTLTAGDILYVDASGNLVLLAKGTNTHVLTLSSGLPIWSAGGAGVSAVPGQFTDAGVTQITTTVATVGLDTEALDPDTNYALSSDEITVSAAGYYKISYSIGIKNDGLTGATRSLTTAFIEKDAAASTYTTISGSHGHCYSREGAGIDGQGLSGTCIVQLVANEVIRIRIINENSTDTSTIAGEVNLNIHKVRD